MSSTVDGLASGLQTSAMINSLMQAEAAPQTKLKTKVKTAQTAVSSYQAVNAKLKAAKSAADSIGQLGSWRALKVQSSSQTATATATGGLSGMAGTVTFDVTKVARAQTTTLDVDTTATTFPASISIQLGSWSDSADAGTEEDTFTAGATPPKTITVEEPRTAEKLAAAVNDAALGIRAYVVKTDTNQGVLQFVGMKSGAANGFEISGLPGLKPSTPAQNAALTVNPGTGAEYQITSATNTFADLMPGVTINVTKKEDGVTINASSDPSAIAAKFAAFVEAANAALTEIKTHTTYDVETKTASPLTGDFTIRQMSQALLGEFSSGLNSKVTVKADGTLERESYDFGSLSKFGIELTSDGQLKFDSGKFTSTYNADPTKMQEAGRIFGDNIKNITNKQSNSITDVITGRKSEIESLNGQISNWDVRLAGRRSALQRQYAALEKSLGNLKNQSSWLSGQLAGLG